jgi:hypothetical protein
MGSGPSQPPGYSGLTPDQIAMVNQQGFFTSPNAVMPNAPNGQPQQLQQPPGYSNLNPSQIEAVNQQGFYTSPDATKQNSLWDNLMTAAGELGSTPKPPSGPTSMPGGSAAMGAPPAPMRPMPGQTQRPPGMGAYFSALQNPGGAGGAGGNAGLMAQYMALQQLMRGA